MQEQIKLAHKRAEENDIKKFKQNEIFKREMEPFNIKVDEIQPTDKFFSAIEEAIIKMKNEFNVKHLEVILNKNFIETKDKISGMRTICGCNVSYEDFTEYVSFIVKEDTRIPTYDELKKENEYSNYCNEELRKKITNLEYKIERLEEENKQLKELCDKYEEEHKTTFEEWKKDIKTNKKAIRQIEIMEKYFELIMDLGYDYDGFNKEEDLKGLVDELVKYASLGRVCNTTEAIYVNQDKKYNILGELIKSE